MNIPTLTLPSGDVEGACAVLLRALNAADVVRTRWESTIDDPRTMHEQLVRGLAESLCGRTWGLRPAERWVDVVPRADPSRDDVRPLHCDEPARLEPVHLVVMFCERRAVSGGDNQFVEAADLIESFAKNVPASMVKAMCGQPLVFERDGSRRTRPFLDTRNGRASVNWDENAVQVGDEETGRLIIAIRDALSAAASSATEVALAPGEAVLWWDDRVLHGRSRVAAGGGDRRFAKAAISVEVTDAP